MKPKLIIFLSIIIYACKMTTPKEGLSEIIYRKYDSYRESSITKRRFKHKDLLNQLQKLKTSSLFSVRKIGSSVQGRDIFMVKCGSGPIKVLLWSQMHGDEATATMALFDIFNFIQSEDKLNPTKDALLNKLTIYFIPMLNPDGAEVFTRRNAQQIDINRDAISLQSPESKVLKNVRDELKPDFGFNLHDQNTRYSAGESGKPATISFLAPPIDYDKTENRVRLRAIKVIVGLNKVLQKYIPGQVAKFSDDFEPRAFGDNIQKWGTSTILVESGGYKDDPEKQYIRKLNFTLLISALNNIAHQDYEKEDKNEYYQIPENTRSLFDLLLRNVAFQNGKIKCKVDVGINRYEVNHGDGDFFYKSTIEDFGDLSVFHGYEEIEGTDLEMEQGQTFPETISLAHFTKEKAMEMLRKGFTSVIADSTTDLTFSPLPLNITSKSNTVGQEIAPGMPANLILRRKGVIKYVVVNGFTYDAEWNVNNIKNGLAE